MVCSTNPVGQKFGQGLKRTAWLFTWYQPHSAELGWKFQSELRTVVQLLSYIWLLVTPWTAAWQAFPVLHHLPEFAQIHVHWVSNSIQPSCPLSSPSPAFSLSQHQGLPMCLFTSGGQGTGWSFSIRPSNEYSGLISFRIDWFDLAVQGTLKSLLQ